MTWLLRAEVASEVAAHFRTGLGPMADQRAEFARQVAASPASPNLRVVGDTASIRIEGLLTSSPDFLARLLGLKNTTYPSIRDALATAGADAAVKRVSLLVNSPGGGWEGLIETLAAIEGFEKPITVVAAQACSAAYAIAAAAGWISAAHVAASFGSIGLVFTGLLDPHQVEIASSHAPNKRPDLRSEAGKTAVRAELDAKHELLAGVIARGRKTTIAKVNAEFGRGGVLLAAEAQRVGMIDRAPKGS